VPDLPAPRAGSDAAAARWWPIEDLGGLDALELAFDHRQIVADGIERARSKLEYTALAAEFVSEPFTIADLRRVYEVVWGVVLDPSNFRRKMLSIDGFLIPTGLTEPTGKRPASLYGKGHATRLNPPFMRPDAANA
jgi:8-oxo-dGTP diphosphatase